MTTVAIVIGGTDYVDRVLFSSARFLSQVNGTAGDCYIRLRDGDRTIDIPSGTDILLTVDGEAVWRGFVSQWKKVYVFPALDVDAFGETRFFDIVGADINVLFAKRIVFNKATPTIVAGKLYPPFQADAPVVADLVTDYLDLSSDTIDTSTFVDNVGDITEDQEGRAWEAGDTWGQAMQSIASLPAAIFYLRPTLAGADLVYCDVDTPTAPYAMNDVPTPGAVGYREMEILKDGTGLINDLLAWGMGYGSQTPVFVRDEDATSQDLHGLWQDGTVRYGIYKQATIDRVAASIVDGSPQSKRGAKNDRLAVTLSTYTPGFLPSQKIDFTSEVWGFNDVIPIRKMEVTFEAPDNPKFALTLSHEIDAPFGFIDPFLFSIGFPKLPPPPPPPPPPGTLGCQCGVTDSGSRTVSPTSHTGSGNTTGSFLGVPEALPWNVTLQGNASCEVAGGEVKLSTTFTPNTLTESHVLIYQPSTMIAIFNRLGPSATGPDVRSFTFKLSALPVDGEIIWLDTNLPGDRAVIWINAGTSFPVGTYVQSNISFGVPGVPDATTVFIPNGQWATNVPYRVNAWQDQTHSYVQIIFGNIKYTTSREIAGLLTDQPEILYDRERSSPSVTSGNITVALDDIYIPEFLKCSVGAMLDNFATVSLSGFGGLVPTKDAWYVTDPTPVTPPVTGWATEIATSVSVTTGLTGTNGVYAGQVEFTGLAGQSAQKLTDATAPWAITDYTITAAVWLLPDSTGDVFFRFGFYDDPTSPTTYRVFDFDTTDGTITISTDAETDSFGPVAYQDGVGFVKIHVERGVICEAKWWFSDEVEPNAYQVSVPDDGSTTDTPVMRFEVTGNTPSEVDVLWIDLDYPNKPCFWNADGSMGLEVQSLQANPYGFGCEVPQRVDGTHYQCSASMVAGSSKLFINGLRQRRGVSADYTENPASGGIILAASVPSTAQVFVCYVGAGPRGAAP